MNMRYFPILKVQKTGMHRFLIIWVCVMLPMLFLSSYAFAYGGYAGVIEDLVGLVGDKILEAIEQVHMPNIDDGGKGDDDGDGDGEGDDPCEKYQEAKERYNRIKEIMEDIRRMREEVLGLAGEDRGNDMDEALWKFFEDQTLGILKKPLPTAGKAATVAYTAKDTGEVTKGAIDITGEVLEKLSKAEYASRGVKTASRAFKRAALVATLMEFIILQEKFRLWKKEMEGFHKEAEKQDKYMDNNWELLIKADQLRAKYGAECRKQKREAEREQWRRQDKLERQARKMVGTGPNGTDAYTDVNGDTYYGEDAIKAAMRDIENR